MHFRLTAALLACLSFAAPAQASGVERAGTVTAVALPLTAAGITILKQDWTGSAQLFVDTGLTVGSAFALKQVIREQRPDKSDFKSFPSDTAALAFAPAQFLWDRYGWEYGVPAYLAAGFVGWSRVDAKKHHAWDVAASAVISFAWSKLITTRYVPRNAYFSTAVEPDGASVTMGYRW
jgi:membrane-associated phospholipid phosphatase